MYSIGRVVVRVYCTAQYLVDSSKLLQTVARILLCQTSIIGISSYIAKRVLSIKNARIRKQCEYLTPIGRFAKSVSENLTEDEAGVENRKIFFATVVY